MKLSVALASLVYLTPTIIQAFPHSYEDGILDVRDAPEALHHQIKRHHDAEPIEGSPDENRPNLIYGKERRDPEFNYETPHDVSNAHGEELMVERDALPVANQKANTYPHYRHHSQHSKSQHTRKQGKSQKKHQSKHHSSSRDEQSQRATSYDSEEKDTVVAKDPDLSVSPQYVAQNDGRVAEQPSHKERDINGAGHQEQIGKAAHTTRPHLPKATHYINGEKDAAKSHTPQFHSKLHEVAAKQGRLPVKPAGPVVEPTGAILKHHQVARDVEPATTRSHHHHYGGTPIPLASRTAIQEKVAQILEHEFPQYSSKIEQHLKDIQAHEGLLMTKREAEPLAQATATSTGHHHHQTRSHLPAASRVVLEEKVAAVLEHNYPQYSGKIEQHLKELQAHHQQHQIKQQGTGQTSDHSKREPDPEVMGVLDEHIHRRGIVERHPLATPPPTLDQQHSPGKSQGGKNAAYPLNHAALPPASRSILNEEIASILEEEYPQYSSKIAAHMKAYKAKHTGMPNAYQAGILGVQQPAMKAAEAANPHYTGLPKREVDTLMGEDGALAHNEETSQTTHSQLRGTGVLLKDYPNPTGYGHYEEYDQPANQESEPQANDPATKLSKWEQYLLNATLHHQLFAAPPEAAAPNPLNSGKVEARGVSSMAGVSSMVGVSSMAGVSSMDGVLSVGGVSSITNPTATSNDFGYFGYTHVPHVPVSENVVLKQALPLQRLAHEVLQGTATISGGYHVASASGVIVSALEKELPVGPDGKMENMLDLDVSMPAAAIHDPENMRPPLRRPGPSYRFRPGGMSPYADSDEQMSNMPRPGERTGRSGAPGWLSELVAEDRAAVSSVAPTFPLPTGSLQQQLAAFNELEATVSSDSPLATNTHLAAQLSANNGLMYDGSIPAQPAKPGQLTPPADDAMAGAGSASGSILGQTGESNPSVGSAVSNMNAPGVATSQGLGADTGPPVSGAEKTEHHGAVKAAANPYANAGSGDMSQDPIAGVKLDPNNVPSQHMRRNLWEMLGVSDDV